MCLSYNYTVVSNCEYHPWKRDIDKLDYICKGMINLMETQNHVEGSVKKLSPWKREYPEVIWCFLKHLVCSFVEEKTGLFYMTAKW